ETCSSLVRKAVLAVASMWIVGVGNVFRKSETGATRGWIAPRATESLQAFEVGNECDFVLGRELHAAFLVAVAPHLVARLDDARVVEPAVHLLPVVLEQAGGDRRARTDVREVRAGNATALVSAHRMARDASL